MLASWPPRKLRKTPYANGIHQKSTIGRLALQKVAKKWLSHSLGGSENLA